MKRQLQIELDPTNNIERDINKNTVHSCLQLKLFEQDVGLQVFKVRPNFNNPIYFEPI